MTSYFSEHMFINYRFIRSASGSTFHSVITFRLARHAALNESRAPAYSLFQGNLETSAGGPFGAETAAAPGPCSRTQTDQSRDRPVVPKALPQA